MYHFFHFAGRMYKRTSALHSLTLAGLLSITFHALAESPSVMRARQIVSQMTLAEKLDQLHGIHDANHYRVVPRLPRLGVAALQVTNGPAGIGPGAAGRQARATALPSPLALAASWDLGLARRYGEIEGQEAHARGNQLLEAPDVNILRESQSGRAFENYGEDPFLTSRIAVANILGIQSQGVLANVKHYLANEQETDRYSINEVISERALREIYMPAFFSAVKEGHVASVMCAYPRLNGTFSCENDYILNTVLRAEWHFNGFVTSDFGAVHSAAPSLKAGLDLELPSGEFFSSDLKKAVESKGIQEDLIDLALVRRFAKMIDFGLFDIAAIRSTPGMPDHAKEARMIAEQSIVLLKNDVDVLPLSSTMDGSIAVIGPYAARARSGGGGSSRVIPFHTVEAFDGIAAHSANPYYVQLSDGQDMPAAVATAKRCQVAIVIVGDDEAEDHDHSTSLSDQDNNLIEAISSVNKHTIVVLKTGAAVTMPWLAHVSAVVEAWYPGQEDGDAVADVLFGDVNPSGKLPVTFPVSEHQVFGDNSMQYPGNHKEVIYSEGIGVGYRWFRQHQTRPLFPFGFGLSYTHFTYTDLTIRHGSVGQAPIVTIQLANTGTRAGAEVVQLYLGFPPIPEGDEPDRQLKAFSKVELKPGESKLVRLALDPQSLDYWSEKNHQWQRPAGRFKVMVGASSEDIRLIGEF